jgi:hypothetical protein
MESFLPVSGAPLQGPFLFSTVKTGIDRASRNAQRFTTGVEFYAEE